MVGKLNTVAFQNCWNFFLQLQERSTNYSLRVSLIDNGPPLPGFKTTEALLALFRSTIFYRAEVIPVDINLSSSRNATLGQIFNDSAATQPSSHNCEPRGGQLDAANPEMNMKQIHQTQPQAFSSVGLWEPSLPGWLQGKPYR